MADSYSDEWWKTWPVNFCRQYLMTSFVPTAAVKGGDQKIINLSSIGAYATRPGISGYQPGKLAVTRFSEFINVEYGEQGDTPEVAGDTIIYLTQKRRERLTRWYTSYTWDMPKLFAKDDILQRDLLNVRVAVQKSHH